MELAISKICTLKGIPAEKVDLLVTEKLMMNSFPALGLLDGSQVPFDDVIDKISRELYIVNPDLSRMKPVHGTVTYKYINAGNPQEKLFMINGTYVEILELTISLIKLFSNMFSPDYVSNINALYQSDRLLALSVSDTSTIDVLFNLLTSTWSTLQKSAETGASCDTLLPLELFYGPLDLVELCFIIINQSLQRDPSVQCYIKTIAYLSFLKQKFGDIGAPYIDSLLTSITELISNILFTTFLHTDDLTLGEVQLASRTEADEVYPDEQLLSKYLEATTLKERIDLQKHALTRHKSRALIFTLFIEVGLEKLPYLSVILEKLLNLEKPHPFVMFQKLDNLLQAIDSGEQELNILDILNKCKLLVPQIFAQQIDIPFEDIGKLLKEIDAKLKAPVR